MTKLRYHQQLTAFVDMSLLHLYMQVSARKGYTPIAKRNDILVAWFKPKVKSRQFDSIKRDIKALIAIGRKKGGNVEQRLWILNDINHEHQKKFTQADDLFILLTHLYEEHGYESQLTSIVDTYRDGVIYMSPTEIETGFSEDSIQIRPLEMFVSYNDVNVVVDRLNEFGGYEAKVTRVSDGYGYIELRRHNN